MSPSGPMARRECVIVPAPLRRLPNPLPRGRKVIRFIRVQMKGLFVRFNREAIFSPAIEAPLEEFDP